MQKLISFNVHKYTKKMSVLNMRITIFKWVIKGIECIYFSSVKSRVLINRWKCQLNAALNATLVITITYFESLPASAGWGGVMPYSPQEVWNQPHAACCCSWRKIQHWVRNAAETAAGLLTFWFWIIFPFPYSRLSIQLAFSFIEAETNDFLFTLHKCYKY